MVIDQVGVAEVNPVLPQLRFALGLIPFVHGAIFMPIYD